MFFHEFRELVGRAAFCERALCVQVGDEHCFVGAEYLVCLGHEVHAAHYYDVGVGFCGFLRQRKAVAHEIGHVLHIARRVVVRQYYCILFAAHPAYFGGEVGACGYGFVYESFLFPAFLYHLLC